MTAWTEGRLGDFIELKRGYDLPTHDRVPGPYPVVSSSGPSGWNDTAEVAAPGVVTGRYGTLGSVFYVEDDFWPLNTTLYVRDFKGNDPRFVSYFLRTFDFAAYSDKAAVPGVNRNALHESRVSLPPLDEQRAIAGVLGALDDKIELNRRMNETIDAITGALYHEWFDRKPADPAPPGWSSRPIGEVVSVRGGSTPRTSEPAFWNGDHAFATPKDLANLSSPVLLGTERRITEEGVTQTNSGLLPRGTVLLSSRAPIGYLAISEIPVSINQGFIALVCDGELPNHYVLRWAQSNLDVIVGAANGTTFLEISKRNFRPLPVLIPPRELLNRFIGVADNLHARVVANLQESETLAELRDALLPKLISGELRVRDAEAAFEAGAQPKRA